MTNRTNAYQFTVVMQNGKPVGDDAELVANLRAFIRESNARRGGRQYVKLQGRLGENNPNAVKYKRHVNGGTGPYYNYQAIRLADAQIADVYIYER